MNKITYTPSEFAALFGKEKTWSYRQLYAGKIQAITQYGRTLIPHTQVEKIIKSAKRYTGVG